MTAITRFALRTNDGLALRAEWATPDDADRVAVLCHPHPLHGGNMYANVVDHLFRHLPESGVAVLRFNFRGVTGSDGRHDYGQREQFDVLAAVDEAAERSGDLPLLLTGWSFGADMALTCPHPFIDGWCAIAPPLRVIEPEQMAAAADPRPVRLVVPEHDQFAPPSFVRDITADWSNTTITVIEGADHFLNDSLDRVLELMIASTRSLRGDGL